MRLRESNVYVVKVENTIGSFYELRIDYPDNSRNFLHWDDEGRTRNLQQLLEVRDRIIAQKITLDRLNTKAVEDGVYYRLESSFIIRTKDDEQQIVAHSRKLNLNDVVYERDLLVEHEDR